MGRIKTQFIKRTTRKAIRDHPDTFKDNFEGNKVAVSEVLDVPSKKLRNVIAGYATRLVKSRSDY